MTASTPSAQRVAERDHAREGLVGQHLAERGAHGRQRAARCRRACRRCRPTSASSARIAAATRSPTPRLKPYAADRHAAADRLADRDDVGLEAQARGAAAGPGADRVGLVDDQQRAVSRASARRSAVVVAGVGQDDADVGQRRLGQHARRRRRWPARASSAARSLNSHDRAWSARGRPAARRCRAAADACRRRRAWRTSRRRCRGSSQLKTRTFGRPVIWRARRSAKRLASVARQRELPERQPEAPRASSSPTRRASSVGSIVVMPRGELRRDAPRPWRPGRGRSSRRCRRGRSRRTRGRRRR